MKSGAAHLVIIPCNLCQSLQRNNDNICILVSILYLPQQCFNLQGSASEALPCSSQGWTDPIQIYDLRASWFSHYAVGMGNERM